ncbi:hypothetical protein AK812_SmicGene21728 [Symbiodinium microadriaticum]|uniref:Uncharacterized protein n=1 Tax=Symbiodinium microadriaticum TaxID=2951 RepID=A0A1Q9DLJ0_SYMMI|nr:hypothetical protein AK812_SmicGene21728 [Symbiodinium microadriaticum]
MTLDDSNYSHVTTLEDVFWPSRRGPSSSDFLSTGHLLLMSDAKAKLRGAVGAAAAIVLISRIRDDRIDLDAVAAHMHGPAPPDKHKESVRFMQPLLGEIVSTIKANSPPAPASSSQSPEAEQLARANRKLDEAGIVLTLVKQPEGAPSPALPTASTKTPDEQTLEKELSSNPSSVPSASSQDAVNKWLKKHQGQFRGKAAAFKKLVAEACLVFKSSEAKRQDLVDTAMKYGLQKSHATKMSFANLSTFIGACQFEAA